MYLNLCPHVARVLFELFDSCWLSLGKHHFKRVHSSQFTVKRKYILHANKQEKQLKVHVSALPHKAAQLSCALVDVDQHVIRWAWSLCTCRPTCDQVVVVAVHW